ncbi:MAG TPA: DUF2089 domain-containing protein [Ktedonobacterales bacterium]|nr:DUF2089 domain-containing protein [Ktedonobacterales bacterium]
MAHETHEVDGTCPVCGSGMMVTRLSCEQCGSALEGAFVLAGRATADTHFGRLARLDRPQLEFVEAFLLCRGVIKNVEDMLGISYPTVKARLANVLDAMGFDSGEEPPAADLRRARREILADLAGGRIGTEEAHALLARNHALLLRDQAPGGDDE